MNTLNSLLQQEMNGKTPEAMEGFRTGDKVRHTQNNYKKDVFNGETGIVHSFDSEEDILKVEYADIPEIISSDHRPHVATIELE